MFSDDIGRECSICHKYKLWDDYYTCSLKPGRTPTNKLTHYSFCIVCYLAKQKGYRVQLKTEVIRAYGNVCACCGEDTTEFLTLDHINNDGAEHRRELGSTNYSRMWQWARKNGFPDTLQLLCWNCNCSKAHFGTCPHQRGFEN